MYMYSMTTIMDEEGMIDLATNIGMGEHLMEYSQQLLKRFTEDGCPPPTKRDAIEMAFTELIIPKLF